MEEGLKEPDPDGSPGAKKGDGLLKDGVGPLGTQKIPFVSGGAEQTLNPPEVGQTVFLEQVIDQGPQSGRQSPGLGEKVLRRRFPIGLGIGGKMRRIHDPMAGMAEIAPMEGDAFGLDEDLDLAGGEPDPDLLAAMEKRNRVIGAFKRDGRVRVDAAHLPVDQTVGFLGKGIQGRFLGFLEPFPAGNPKSGMGTVVDPGDQEREHLVDLGQASEAAVPKAPTDMPLKDADRAFHEGFVPGATRPCRNHGRAVMNGQIQVGGVQIRIVEVGLQHSGLGVIGDGDPAHPAKRGIHRLVGQEPAGLFLVDGRKGKQELAVAENPDKDLGLLGAVPFVPPQDRIAGIIDFAMSSGLELPEPSL